MGSAQLILVLVIALTSAFADEIDVKFATARPNKYVNERFINFHVDPADLVEILTTNRLHILLLISNVQSPMNFYLFSATLLP